MPSASALSCKALLFVPVLLAAAGAAEEACDPGSAQCRADDTALLQHASKILKEVAAHPHFTCKPNDHVDCGQGTMCAGNQCCPGGYTCPSATPGFRGCPEPKQYDCVETPQACCKALTAPCLACEAGMTVGDYCKENPETVGCPKACCKAMTAECLACAADMTEQEYCKENPGTSGCPKDACDCGCDWLSSDSGYKCDKCARRCRRANKLPDYACASRGPWQNTQNCDCQWLWNDNCADCHGCAVECRNHNPHGPCSA